MLSPTPRLESSIRRKQNNSDGTKTINLGVRITPELNARLENLGAQYRHPSSKLAFILLEWSAAQLEHVESLEHLLKSKIEVLPPPPLRTRWGKANLTLGTRAALVMWLCVDVLLRRFS